MEIATTPVSLGKTKCLITNAGPDDLLVGEYGQDSDAWYVLESGSSITITPINEIGVVSSGVSDVGVLVGGTGVFPPVAEDVDLSGYETTAEHDASLAAYSPYGKAQAINAQVGTSYTLVAADVGKLVTLSNGSPIALSVPQDSDATIAIGSYVDLYQLGGGQVTVQIGTGATLRVSGLTAKLRAQYSSAGVQKVSANTWRLFGDLAAS